MHVSSPFDEAYESIDKSVLIELGLIVGKDARHHRRNFKIKNCESAIPMVSSY